MTGGRIEVALGGEALDRIRAAVAEAREELEAATALDLERFAEAFAVWEQRFRDDPEAFVSDWQRATQSTGDYGQACAAYFVELLREIQAEES